MMTAKDHNQDPNPQETIKTIYETVKSDAEKARESFETIVERTDGQYLVIRDKDGNILIKVSLIGGIIAVAFGLFVTRLRWMPLMPLILAAVYMNLSVDIDRDNTVKKAIEQTID
jgi:hypothetical protein